MGPGANPDGRAVDTPIEQPTGRPFSGEAMDTQEARTVVAKELRRYRAMRYQELQRLLKEQDHLGALGPSGVSYQLEVEAVWDDRPGGNLRVFGHIDDGSLRAVAPLTEDFIMAPDGSFVGE